MLTCPAPGLLKQAIQSPSRAQLVDHIPPTSRSPVVIISSSHQCQSFHKGLHKPLNRLGNKAETATIIPIAEAFQAAHGIEDLIIVAGRRHALGHQPDGPGRGEAAVHRLGPAPPGPPGDLEAHFHWHGDAFTDGQLIDTITPRRGSRSQRDISSRREPVWDPHTHPGSWRAVWVYSKKRAARDNQTLTAQANRARAIRRRREAP